MAETFQYNSEILTTTEPTLDELKAEITRLELEKQIMGLKLEIAKLHAEILKLTQPTITWTGNDDTGYNPDRYRTYSG